MASVSSLNTNKKMLILANSVQLLQTAFLDKQTLAKKKRMRISK